MLSSTRAGPWQVPLAGYKCGAARARGHRRAEVRRIGAGKQAVRAGHEFALKLGLRKRET